MSLKSLRHFATTGCTLLLSITLFAQGFSFNCTRDTLVPGCPTNLCFTLKGIIPDIKGLSTSYSLNPTSPNTGCFPVYGQPDDPAGTATNLTVDDTYSGVINIGFPFSFFGGLYSSLVASTNGYVSFDVSLAFGSSHWQNRGDLPDPDYDPALIMGPYHDLFPGQPTSPTQRIQYQLFGTAPHRRWILSFYRVPLFSCTSLIENTHQIILYESTGIIEVSIFSKQICGTWQGGKAMVGVQDFSKTQGMTAPQRKMSDPAWGSIGMNESWRFVPNAGPSLFKRVELYDLGGTLLATGTTTNLGNGQLEASFPNVCPPAGTITSYIIRSVYEKIDDPAVEVFGSDTVRVDRANGIVATASSTPASCGSLNGTIAVSSPTGGTPPYEYSLDGIVWQSSNTFTGLAAGNYNVTIRDNGGVCTTTIPVTIIFAGNLPATTTTNATACTGVNNGSITITSAGGTGPYTFTLDGGVPQPGTIPFTFSNISSGNHTVLVTDVSTGCVSNVLNVNVAAGPGVTASATVTATGCTGASNGTITVSASTGTPPFNIFLDGNLAYTGALPHTFLFVAPGNHTLLIADNNGCGHGFSVNVPIGPPFPTSFTTMATSCNGAADGTITLTPSGGLPPYSFSLDGAPVQFGSIPFTFTNVTPGPHNVAILDALYCTVNVSVNVPSGPNLTTTINKTDVLCNGAANGTITITQPSLGIPPFEYSLDGSNWQASPNFTGLPAGPYTVYFRSANGCQGSQGITIGEPTILLAASSNSPVICFGESNGVITISASGGVAPYQYSINGGANWQSNPTFNVPVGNYTVIIRDVNGCTRSEPVSITQPALLTANASTANASCDGGNDGSITITATGGNSGFEYSLDGINFQSSNVFNVAPGNYTVTVRDILGCNTTFPTTVGLSNNLTLSAPANPTICESKSVQLQVNSNATVYSWSPATGLSDTAISNPVASPVVTTPYTVTATLGRCSSLATVIVNVNAAPVPDAGPPGFICYGQTYTLQGSGGSIFNWAPGTYLSSTTDANPLVTPDKTITYTLSVIDANGCNSLVTDEVTVDVTPPIKVSTFPFDTIAHPGDKFQLLATSIAPNYTWSPAIGLSDPNISNPILTVGPLGSDQVYQVIAFTDAGCRGEGYVRLRVYKGPDIYVPNAFTPDNDGRNDRFYPFPVGIRKINYFRVFNRWGQMVFSSAALHQGWDGKMGGQEQSSGMYVWMAEAVAGDGKVITKQGTVMLIR